MFERWNAGVLEFWSVGRVIVLILITPSLHYSITPSIHYSTIPQLNTKFMEVKMYRKIIQTV
ncbi:MAG TPA: hypothetical protein VGD14_06460, partial [bacterium]